jgi:hypothetical protein
MMNKKVTRKEFLLSALSIAGVVMLSKVPTILKKSTVATQKSSYGNSAYGGSNKNA